jgi:DNA processing protein
VVGHAQSDQGHPQRVDTARVVALATLDGMTPARLSALTEGRPVDEAWNEVVAGRAAGGPAGHLLVPRPAELAAAWSRAVDRLDPHEVWRAHHEAGVRPAIPESAHYPAALVDDPCRPAVLFQRGDDAALDGPRVAIVGTRDCTRYGRDLAFELGRDLANEGVRVVSGLALGIDSAAHAGALESDAAPPVGVVGSGLDVVYPRRNASLWRAVGERGVLLTEHPLGRPPAAWHFPARNRIIAAMADVVVVVESHASGGALNTAEHAIDRSIEVMAVPGSVRSEASIGSNRLLDVAHVCQGADDVMTLLGLDGRARERGVARRDPPSVDDAAVLDALEWEPTSLETLMLRTGLALGQLSSALDRLERAGWIARRGSWSERRAAGS